MYRKEETDAKESEELIISEI